MNETGRLKMIKAAREVDMSEEEIMRAVLQGEPAGSQRRTMVVEWGRLLGLDPIDALRLAHKAGLIPTPHPPRGLKIQTPPNKDLERPL
jgi:hypothetical protein